MVECPQMRIEFGIPADLGQACLRLPDRTHRNYSIANGPYQHCAHLKEFLEDMQSMGVKNIRLEDRMAPLVTEDLRLLFNLNSLKRKLTDDVLTVNWACLNPNGSPWSDLLPVGGDNHK